MPNDATTNGFSPDDIEWMLTRLFHSSDALEEPDDYELAEQLLARWRAAHGVKSDWRWCARYIGDDNYDGDYNTVEQAVLNLMRQGFETIPIEVIQASMWTDEIKPIDDYVPFAETRDKRILPAPHSPVEGDMPNQQPILTEERIAAGWLSHDGGPCPVPLGSRPGVMFRDGEVWQPGVCSAGFWAMAPDSWQHEDSDHSYDIIAYRPEPQP